MKKAFALLIVCFACSAAFSQISRESTHSVHYIPEEVTYESGAIEIKLALSPDQYYSNSPSQEINALKEVLAKYGVIDLQHCFPTNPNLNRWFKVHLPKSSELESAIRDISKLSIVELAEKVPLPISNAVPGDLNPAILWYLDKINMKQSWDIQPVGTQKIKIAIVDNAIRIAHEDIRDNLWTNPGEIPNNHFDDDGNGYVDDINGWDVADNDNNPSPPSDKVTDSYFSHGTHVAGLTSASTDNSKGIVSLGFNTEIIAVKTVKDRDHESYMLYAYEGIEYAVRAGADIINLSWSAAAYNSRQKEIIAYALNSGCIIVAAAGNYGNSNKTYPASFDGVIAVGATDNYDRKISKSSYGPWVDLMAPGDKIYSTLAGSNSSYGYQSGTSQAAPLVSGFIGLILSKYPNLKGKPDSVLHYLGWGCDNIDLDNWLLVGNLGSGRINVDRTFAYLEDPSTVGKPVIETISAKIYPNPATGYVNISSQETISSVEIFDLQGRKLLCEQNNTNRISLESIPNAGIYLVKINSEKGASVQRLSVVR